ncbi:MAG: YggS family pyridoxal phosphate enzyme [Melioribacteraceae bacterium]|nr:MAG: YggS family pyridoxal phosphate enzyme [Melioribacteraceae bacterium]
MIEKNINIVEERIKSRCAAAGRNPSDITLVAVSKTHPAEMVREAFSAGLIHFGENKAQEMDAKSLEIKESVLWHFIGHLQTNKVKNVIKSAEYIHSVESVKLAAEIEKRAAKLDKVQKVLLEIKTSSEESKFGLETEDQIKEVADFCMESGNIQLSGFMTMAPFTDDESVIRKSFSNLRELKEKFNARGYGLDELSMGMTSDYEIAIEEGSTMLRVGTAIFGSRSYTI